jgi:hypothetical protein
MSFSGMVRDVLNLPGVVNGFAWREQRMRGGNRQLYVLSMSRLMPR